MSDFVPFTGFAQRLGATVRLTASGGNGLLEFSSDDVSFQDNQIVVRRGAVASNIQEPAQGSVADRPSVEAVRADCPGGITCCIGGVHVCCGDFRVIGVCHGAWGCARPGFIP